MDNTRRDYLYQIEYHKKDGTILTIFVFSEADRYVYSIYEGLSQYAHGTTGHDTTDEAFQDAFDFLKAGR